MMLLNPHRFAAPTVPVLIEDLFSSGAFTTGRTPDTTTGGATWTVHDGTYSISGGNAVGSGGAAIASIDAGVTNMDVRAAVEIGASGGICVRQSSDGLDRFEANWNAAGTYLALYQVTGGAYSFRGDYSGTISTGDVIRLVANGTTLYVYINATLRITVTGQTSFSSNTRAGLASQGTYRDFAVWTL